MMRTLRGWRTFLAIMGAGLAAGFLTWTAGRPAPVCHQHCVSSYYKDAPPQQAGP